MSAKDTLILKKRLHIYTYDTKRDYAHIMSKHLEKEDKE